MLSNGWWPVHIWWPLKSCRHVTSCTSCDCPCVWGFFFVFFLSVSSLQCLYAQQGQWMCNDSQLAGHSTHCRASVWTGCMVEQMDCASTEWHSTRTIFNSKQRFLFSMAIKHNCDQNKSKRLGEPCTKWAEKHLY